MTKYKPAFAPALITIGSMMFAAASSGAIAQPITEDLELHGNNTVMSDQFAWSISTDSGMVAVSAFIDDEEGSNPGRAYIFDAATGTQTVELIPNDDAINNDFGHSIAIDSGVVAVGAFGDDDNGSASGAVYLFDATTGAQIMKIFPNDPAVDDYFGKTVAIDNGVVAVGSHGDDDNGSLSGSAYLFNAATGAQIAKLLPSDGAAEDFFGASIAIDRGVVVVGAYGDDDRGPSSGSAYLFDAATGAQLDKLLASDGAADDEFGAAVSISGDLVVVGAWLNDAAGADSGAVYCFDATTGVQSTKLASSDLSPGDFFGFSVAVDEDTVAVGSVWDDDNGSASGSAYLFNGSTGDQLEKLIAGDGASEDWFAFSIAIDDGIVAVGAPLHDDPGSDFGSAYVYDVGPCQPDTNGDGILDQGDIGAFVQLFLAADLAADFNADGFLDIGDIGAFVAAFLAGC